MNGWNNGVASATIEFFMQLQSSLTRRGEWKFFREFLALKGQAKFNLAANAARVSGLQLKRGLTGCQSFLLLPLGGFHLSAQFFDLLAT